MAPQRAYEGIVERGGRLSDAMRAFKMMATKPTV